MYDDGGGGGGGERERETGRGGGGGGLEERNSGQEAKDTQLHSDQHRTAPGRRNRNFCVRGTLTPHSEDTRISFQTPIACGGTDQTVGVAQCLAPTSHSRQNNLALTRPTGLTGC